MGRKPIYIALLFLLTLTGNSWARIWYVKPDSTGAVINIQAGIDSCAAGDTVVAMPGVYSGDGNWDLDFKGKPIVVMSASRHDLAIMDSTVIDGTGKHRGFHFHSGETNASILEGFVITNGHDCTCVECSCPSYWGGGIACDSASSPLIRYNKINHCYSSHGGGIYCSGFSSPIISNNKIYQCGANDGTAIYCSDSVACYIDNNEIYDNCADHSHIIVCVSSSPVFVNNIIHGNTGCPGGYGSFLVLFTSCPSVTLVDNHIYGNGLDGLSIDCVSATIKDNEIWGNQWMYTGMTIDCATLDIVGNSIHDNGWSGSAIICHASSFATIDRNYIHGNGRYPGGFDFHGYGIEVSNSRATISNNEVSANSRGGIAYYGDSAGTIENNIIIGNGALHDECNSFGGIRCWAPISIIGNIVKNNAGCENRGGGISCYSSASIRDNIIVLNTSRGAGGIWCEGPAPSIVNNTIVGNSGYWGAGVYFGSGCHSTFTGNIIADNLRNTCGDSTYCKGGGIYSESDSISISCCDVFDNAGGNYIGMPDQSGMNGNFSADPMFCDASSGNYTLNAASPCLLGNHPNGASCGLIGALASGCGLARPRGLTGRPIYYNGSLAALLITWNRNIESNIFHYEVYRDSIEDFVPGPGNLLASPSDTFLYDVQWRWFPHRCYKVAAVDSNGHRSGFALLPPGDLTGTDGSEGPKATYLSQNYPNPFNPVTRIEFGLRESARISLRIYDAAGRLLRVVFEAQLPPGRYARMWDGKDTRGVSVASGVYFYRLDAGSFTKTKKLVLLR